MGILDEFKKEREEQAERIAIEERSRAVLIGLQRRVNAALEADRFEFQWPNNRPVPERFEPNGRYSDRGRLVDASGKTAFVRECKLTELAAELSVDAPEQLR